MTTTAAPDQIALPIGELVSVDASRDLSIQERFARFHKLNPWILDTFEVLTKDMLERGRNRIGIGMLTEVVRWQYARETRGDTFKIDNSYRSRYVRLLIEKHPEWADVFETRALRSA